MAFPETVALALSKMLLNEDSVAWPSGRDPKFRIGAYEITNLAEAAADLDERLDALAEAGSGGDGNLFGAYRQSVNEGNIVVSQITEPLFMLDVLAGAANVTITLPPVNSENAGRILLVKKHPNSTRNVTINVEGDGWIMGADGAATQILTYDEFGGTELGIFLCTGDPNPGYGWVEVHRGEVGVTPKNGELYAWTYGGLVFFNSERLGTYQGLGSVPVKRTATFLYLEMSYSDFDADGHAPASIDVIAATQDDVDMENTANFVYLARNYPMVAPKQSGGWERIRIPLEAVPIGNDGSYDLTGVGTPPQKLWLRLNDMGGLPAGYGFQAKWRAFMDSF